MGFGNFFYYYYYFIYLGQNTCLLSLGPGKHNQTITGNTAPTHPAWCCSPGSRGEPRGSGWEGREAAGRAALARKLLRLGTRKREGRGRAQG